MKLLMMTTALALAFLPAEDALAKNKKAKHGGKGAVVMSSGCPPGLAKKNNGCQPPGQLKRKNDQGGNYGGSAEQNKNFERDETGTVLRKKPETIRSGSDEAVAAHSIDHVILESGDRIRIGDGFDAGSRDRARVISNPGLFGLEPGGAGRRYFRLGETAVLVDDRSGEVLRLFALKDVLIR